MSTDTPHNRRCTPNAPHHVPGSLDPSAIQHAGGWVRLDAAAIADADRVHRAPGAMLLRFDGPPYLALGAEARIEAIGTPARIDTHPRSAAAVRLALPDSVILPGLVNAHTHLDLTHVGPQPHDPEAGFVAWVRMIRDARQTDDDAIADSVARGIDLALAGGTVAVGDIAGAPPGRLTLAPLRTLRESPLHGVSFLENFGIGPEEPEARARFDALIAEHEGELIPAAAGDPAPRVRFGLSPHAPNTVGLAAYRRLAAFARDHALPITTHLAETPEEREFVAHARGSQRDLLEGFGLWDDRLLDEIGRGDHPIEHLAEVLAMTPFLAAHVNDAAGERGDRLIEALAGAGCGVAYCPRAADYFGAPDRLGPHRYRAMLEAGIPVCLGTDSLVNLPPGAADPAQAGFGVLEEMRRLHQRDATDPRLLLAMGTTIAARCLGLDPDRFRLEAGACPAGLVAVRAPAAGNDPLGAVVRNAEPPALLFCGK